MKISNRKTYFLLVAVLLLSVISFSMLMTNDSRLQSSQIIPEGFRSELMLRITPVKDQGKNELCWVYAMLATIETEHLMQEDSVNLSVDYIARMYLEEQALERFHTKGNTPISMRGMGPMTIDLLLKYGAMPHDSYYPKKPVNYNVLLRKIENTVDIALSGRYDEARCMDDVRHQLDQEIGYLPRFVFMFGMQYTFLEFAHSVCMRDEYTSLTSLPSAPYDKNIRLPFADNHYDCEAMNLTPDSLLLRVEESLRQGHPVMWEGGTDDDHAVSIIGMGKDAHGKEYFVAKNSWGKDNPTQGLLYLEKEYLKHHTAVAVVKQCR